MPAAFLFQLRWPRPRVQHFHPERYVSSSIVTVTSAFAESDLVAFHSGHQAFVDQVGMALERAFAAMLFSKLIRPPSTSTVPA